MSDEHKEKRYGRPAGGNADGTGRNGSGYKGGTGHSGNIGGNAGYRGSAAGKSYGRPASGGRPAGNAGYKGGTGGKSFSRPVNGDGAGHTGSVDDEKRYSRPAGGGASSGDRSFSRPAGGGAPSGNRSFGRPAGGGAPSGDRSFGRPAGGGAPSGDRSFGRPSGGGAPSGNRSFGRPSGGGAPSGNRSFGRPAGGGASSGDRSFSRPAGGGAPSGDHSFGRPAGSGASSGNRPFSRPAGDKPYNSDRPAAPGGDHKYNRHSSAGGAPSGNRPYSRPAGGSGFRPGGARPAGPRRDRPGMSPRPPFGRKPEEQPTETTGLDMSARRVALDILQDVHENGAYASLSLNAKLIAARLKPEDRRLVTGIVYGVLENEIRIDYILDSLMEHPTREAVQRDILRLSAYQILFLDRVPDSAAVNEGVKLVKAMGMESSSGFINAVLRNLIRGKDAFEWPKREDDWREYLHIMTSTPLWLIDRLTAAYGQEEAEALLSYHENGHPIVARPNLTKLTDEEFEALLRKKEINFERGVAPHAFLLSGLTEPGMDPDYQAGLFSIQGQSSILAAQAMEAKPGMKLLDACAAPGGKSGYMCEQMAMTGRVYAWELHEKRAMLLEGVKRRLKLDNLRVVVRDATEYREDWDNTLDGVLLDAPCSGTGVTAQKPDIKLRLKEEDIPAITATQKKLLNTLCRYIKRGGLMVYSTCSILPEENTEQVKTFLDEHPEYALEPLPSSFPEALRRRQGAYGLQLLSHRDQVEGFFIARLRRIR